MTLLTMVPMVHAQPTVAGSPGDSAGTPASTAPAVPPAAASVPAVVADAYRLGPEDILDIAVWKEPDLSRKDVLVRPDGGISFPLIGEVQVAGRSVADVRHELAARLRSFLPDPVVSVSLVKILYQRVYVIGKVNKPGEFMMGRQLDVLQALSMAGGLTPFAAANDIRIVRREGGEQVTLPFHYSRIEKGDGLEQNILLRPADVVVVP
jgi:polysaccharide export outer membrane protein